MAGLLQYQGSELPERVRRAAQFELDAKKAQSARIPLAMEGSGLPESVRKAAQAALEKGAMPRIPNAPIESPGAWAEGSRSITGDQVKGLLGAGKSALATGAKALGPLAAGYDLVTSANERYGMGAWDRAQETAQGMQTRADMKADPGLPSRGQATVNRITDNAIMGSRGIMEPEGVMTSKPTGGVLGLMDKARQLPREQAAAALQKEAMPMPAEKQNAVDEVAQQAPEVEAGRQRLEAGALQGLQSGEVHISDLAKGVAQADAQRAGTELKPEEEKAAVQAEIQAMKTMDNEQLAKYVSYALIAGGLLASVFDESGQAGAAFHDSLNKQLDRNLASGKLQQQQAQAAAKLALDTRKVDLSETDIDSKIADREAQQGFRGRGLDQKDTELGITQQRADIANFSAKTQASQGAQRLGLMGAANDLRARDTESKIAAREAKMNQNTQKGVAPSVKDATGLAEEYMKGQGLKPDTAVVTALGARIPTIMKNYPELSAVQALEIAQDELGDTVMTEDNMIFSNKTRFRKPKDK